MKIGLGTAQFGMDYGISNREGKTDVAEVVRILTAASESGIRVLDTASAYAKSEAVLGDVLSPSLPFSIVTKTPPVTVDVITEREIENVSSAFYSSLEKLGQKSIYGLLVHQADRLLVEGGWKIFDQMQAFKKSGLVSKIGVSVYDRVTLDRILDRFPLDLIQIPLNVFDQRMLANNYLANLKKAGIEIHARSAFLQGLLLMEPDKLPAHFSSIIDHVRSYRSYLAVHEISPLEAALGFVLSLNEVDVVLCGVNNLDQLVEIVEVAGRSKVDFADFRDFALTDERIINPSLWNV
ncbi:MAG: aldo/keto reductase [Mariprofundaceae bacterium]|nr:aldo/keto reductase [Mariprofundaceae bacterium]